MVRPFENLEEMDKCGSFEEQQAGCNVVYHWDLQPRNILIRAQQSFSIHSRPVEWVFDNVIDWDDVDCVPPLLTRCPPVWLWDFSDDNENSALPEGYDGDADLLPVDQYTPHNGPLPQGEKETIQYIKSSLVQHRLSPEDDDIKQYFELQFVKGLATIYPNM